MPMNKKATDATMQPAILIERLDLKIIQLLQIDQVLHNDETNDQPDLALFIIRCNLWRQLVPRNERCSLRRRHSNIHCNGNTKHKSNADRHRTINSRKCSN